ncbi:MAG: phage gp6-like head-tail connector protein [Methylobacterium mesophilicum]|nr:phage gp6-like head-tail connector protein [Methylobacterium mesophilicum]
MSIVSLGALKAQLQIDFDDFDTLLQSKLDAAEAWAENFMGCSIYDFGSPLPADIQEAVLQLAAHWYVNREATLVGLNAAMMPFGVISLLSPHMEAAM